MKIKGTLEGELSIKRLYLDGLEVKSQCPKCKKIVKFDDHIEYPKMNSEVNVNFYCTKCEACWEEKAYLKVELEVK